MSVSAARFAPPSEQDVTRLVLEYPLAWIVSAADGEFAATPLPLRPVIDPQGGIVELRGHFARSNPHADLAHRVPRALLLFTGPNGYVSPSWLGDRTRAPTWNYAMVQYVVDLEFVEDAERRDDMMRDLVDAMEAGRPNAWSIEDMGTRYERLAAGVRCFRAHIRERRVRFKLGQDERATEYADIVAALASTGDHTLLEWTRRANTSRDG
jgi:transcriptional regulator